MIRAIRFLAGLPFLLPGALLLWAGWALACVHERISGQRVF